MQMPTVLKSRIRPGRDKKNWMYAMICPVVCLVLKTGLCKIKTQLSKTKFIIMGSRQQMKKVNLDSIDVNGATFERVNSVKYLEVHTDCPLNLKHHMSVKCRTE